MGRMRRRRGRGEQPVASDRPTCRESVRGAEEDAGEQSGGLLHCSPRRHGKEHRRRMGLRCWCRGEDRGLGAGAATKGRGRAVPRPVTDGRPAACHRSARGGIAVLVPWREKGSGSGEPVKKGRGARRRGRSRTAGMLHICAGGRQPELGTARRHRKLGKVGGAKQGRIGGS
jgi:hypothetical protein